MRRSAINNSDSEANNVILRTKCYLIPKMYLIDWSTTDWHPRNDKYFKKPPHLWEMFSITGPCGYNIVNNTKSVCFIEKFIPQCPVESQINLFFANSIRPMPECSNIYSPKMNFCEMIRLLREFGVEHFSRLNRIIPYKFTWAQRHNETTSKYENIRNKISRGSFVVISASSGS